MSDQLLTSHEAAKRLGLSVASLYEWLARSDSGEFILRGTPFTINYYQGGARGQGRIQIETSEIDRIKAAMRVRPKAVPKRRQTVQSMHFPGITVPLGKPDNA